MKNKNLIIIVTILFLVGCGNPELENAKNNLEFAIADKDHYLIIKHANEVLEIDPEDINAKAAFRDSVRVYSHIREAAENLKKLDEVEFDEESLMFSMDTSNDDPLLIEYAIDYFNENIGEYESNDASFKKLNQHVAGYSEDEAQAEITDLLKAKFVILEASKLYGDYIDVFSSQIDYLAEARKSLKKAERLDPRFRGVIDLEEIIESRAELYTNYVHAYFAFEFMDYASDAAGFFDKVYNGTNTKWDTWIALDMTSYFGIADAYKSARSEILLKDWSLSDVFDNYQNNSQKLVSLYKDLEDEFEDIDSLEPGIELAESMVDIFKLTEATGNLSQWNAAMTEAVDRYVESSSELANEIEVDKLQDDKDDINESIDEILDDDIINAIDSSDFI
jgi:hypothetical protein